MKPCGPSGYSSRVRIQMCVNGRRLAVSQVGRNFAILRQPADIPAATEAQIVIEVDGHCDVHLVYVPHSVRNSRCVDFAPRSLP